MFWVFWALFWFLMQMKKRRNAKEDVQGRFWIFHQLCKQKRNEIVAWSKSWDSSCLNRSGSKVWVQRHPAAVDVAPM